jgi:hypothetical protein
MWSRRCWRNHPLGVSLTIDVLRTETTFPNENVVAAVEPCLGLPNHR